MIEEKKPYLIINEEYDEIKINIKHTKPYMKLQQEIKQLKAKLEMYENGVYYSSENDKLKEVIEEVREHIKEQKKKPYKSLSEKATICNKYNELLQILDKVKDVK